MGSACLALLLTTSGRSSSIEVNKYNRPWQQHVTTLVAAAAQGAMRDVTWLRQRVTPPAAAEGEVGSQSFSGCVLP
jgi:hypothetical protein